MRADGAGGPDPDGLKGGIEVLLHIGADVTVLLKDVVAILNARAGTGEATREFLGRIRHGGGIRSAGDGKTKSIIVLGDKVYNSPISSITLMKRAVRTRGLGDLG